MRKHFLPSAWALLSLLTFSELAAAKQPAKPPVEEIEVPDVIVTAGEQSEGISYQAIVRGIEAFSRYKRLAPGATPKFVVQPRQPNASLKGLNLIVATASRDIDVPLDKNGVFAAPQNEVGENSEARIILNRPDEAYAIKPFVRTPGLPPNIRRLGDFRAQCEMRWAMERDNESVPLSARLLAGALGSACHNSMIKIIFREPRPIVEIWLMSGQRREALPQERIRADRVSFIPPLEDDSWPNDTLIELKFVATDTVSNSK
ncbi:hypothetical protein M2322_004191 [Rhodoblastus acidophilus]|uniref:hypothetical protein n=1 Tax=Rhodoblastus acidophilus TaxID=1074 RepID=UPI00222466CC|nr:hypothetical protein [Rhodoblastus acidophilus]MCW2318622.1 hypothetical protein [Rhodoblastus acidophilus]